MADRTMRALVGERIEGPDAFALARLPVPEPGPGEVRIAVEAVAFGYVDGLIAAGRYQIKPALPFVPGGEIAGIVDALGAGVEGFAIGARVATWQLGGGAADYCVAPAADLNRLPDGLEMVQAAAMMVDAATAHYALFDRGGLASGETVLVLGAGGGVGAAVVQLAWGAGARVIAAVSSCAKRDHVMALGAHGTVDYGEADWRDRLKDLLPSTGLDMVIDPVGGAVFEPAFRSLAKGGRHLVLGFAGGEIPRLPANLPLIKSASLIGVDLRHLAASRPDALAAIRHSLFERAAAGHFTVPIGARLPLGEAGQALYLLADRGRIGKVAILPRL